jgi:hypothetical protein
MGKQLMAKQRADLLKERYSIRVTRESDGKEMDIVIRNWVKAEEVQGSTEDDYRVFMSEDTYIVDSIDLDFNN